jgi:glycosyltransferase involved in cell wall biosynthesis
MTETAPPPGAAERPLATLFITSYNQEDYVGAAIDGAFAQTWSPLEIVMSDDASTDATFRIMEARAAAYRGPHRIVLNRNERNLGIVPHVEKVMALASGELIVENAADDVSVPHRVERMVEAWLASGRRAKAIHSARRRMDETGGLHEVFDDARVLAHQTPLEVIRDHGTMVGASLAWDRAVWDVFGPQSPIAIFDDFPTCFRAALIGEIHYLDEPLLHYRTGGTSARPTDRAGWNHLYGFRIKDLRWHRSFWLRYLADMEIVEPPDAEECRRLCREKIARADFLIGLAETPRARLPLALPRNLRRSLAEGDPVYLVETLKYLAGPLYEARLDAKKARAAARRDAAGAGAVTAGTQYEE